MTDFDKDFDKLLKNALNSDSDLDGLTVNEELIASTMKAIDEAAPRKEEIRASYDESFPEKEKSNKKSFFTSGNIIKIAGVVAGLAAVAMTFVFISNNYSSDEATNDAATTMASAESTETPMKTYGAQIQESSMDMEESAPQSATAAINEGGMAAPAEDGLYYFEDDSLYMRSAEDGAELLDNVYTLYDKNLYKVILDTVKDHVKGEPAMSDMMGSANEEVTAEPMMGNGGDGESKSKEEDFDFNDPSQLAGALKESKEKLEETGGLPSEDAKEVIGSIEVNGETVPDFDYSPEKNPYWVPIENASDEQLAAFSPEVVIYDQDVDADLDVCVQVYEDRCVIYDFAAGTMTTYDIESGKELAEKLRNIAAQ